MFGKLIAEGLAYDVSPSGGTVGTFSAAVAFPCGGGAWWSSRQGRWIPTYYSSTPDGLSRSCRHYAQPGGTCASRRVADIMTNCDHGLVSADAAVVAIRQVFAEHSGPAMSPETGQTIT